MKGGRSTSVQELKRRPISRSSVSIVGGDTNCEPLFLMRHLNGSHVLVGHDRETTPDFLTSMTSPNQRRVLPGFEHLAPRTPDEFAKRWQESRQRQTLLVELGNYQLKHPADERLIEFKESRHTEQAKSQPARSPYNISYAAQVSLNLWRGWRRLLADPAYTIASLVFQIIMALMLGSMFYQLKEDTSTFYYRGGIIFFSLLFNAFASQLEVGYSIALCPIITPCSMCSTNQPYGRSSPYTQNDRSSRSNTSMRSTASQPRPSPAT